MICWLQGKRIDIWQQGMRKGIVIATKGVGYEVQTLPREQDLFTSKDTVTVWVHQVQRDESIYLYGFLNKEERDLFRILISVNGVGPQIGIALLQENGEKDLINAVKDKDIKQLSKAQGVGKRTAERLIIELKEKLSEKMWVVLATRSFTLLL